MPDEYDFYIKKGNTGPALQVQFQDEDGNAIDITGSSNLMFYMRNRETGANAVSSYGSTVDVTTGTVLYSWSTVDTATAGDYEGEFEVTLSGGQIITFPNYTFIKIKIGETAK